MRRISGMGMFAPLGVFSNRLSISLAASGFSILNCNKYLCASMCDTNEVVECMPNMYMNLGMHFSDSD